MPANFFAGENWKARRRHLLCQAETMQFGVQYLQKIQIYLSKTDRFIGESGGKNLDFIR